MPYRSKYEGADPGVPNPGAHSVIEGMKTGWKSLSHIAFLAPPVIPIFYRPTYRENNLTMQ